MYLIPRDRAYWGRVLPVLADFWWGHVVPARLHLERGGSLEELERFRPPSVHALSEVRLAGHFRYTFHTWGGGLD